MNKNTYVSMQSNHYENAASSWDLNNRDPVVGSFDQHNNWSDYDEYLFKHCINFDSCLDFGCGPGRNIVKYNNRFKIFDGIDISQINLENAIKWLDFHKCSREPNNESLEWERLGGDVSKFRQMFRRDLLCRRRKYCWTKCRPQIETH